VVQTCTQQTQDGDLRWRRLLFKETEKSPYLSNSLTDQCEMLHTEVMMYTDHLNHAHSCKLQSLKIQDHGWPVATIFEKSLNRHNSASVPSIFTKFGKMMHFGRIYLAVDGKNSDF